MIDSSVRVKAASCLMSSFSSIVFLLRFWFIGFEIKSQVFLKIINYLFRMLKKIVVTVCVC